MLTTVLSLITLTLLSAVAYLVRANRSLKRRLTQFTANNNTTDTAASQQGATAKTTTPNSSMGIQTTSIQQVLTPAEEFAAIDHRVDEQNLFLNADFGREALCAISGLSKERIGQLIRQFGGGGNVQTYLNRKRVAYALTLMQQYPNYSMEAIAEECGIGNLSTFYRVFKQVYGTSPNEYRKIRRNNQQTPAKGQDVVSLSV